MTSQADVEAFKQHTLWQRATETLDNYRLSRPKTPDDRATVERVVSSLEYLLAFRSLPVSLFPSDRLSAAINFESWVSAISNQHAAWDQSAAMPAAMIAELDTQCDSILRNLNGGNWPQLQKESRARVFQEAADAYRNVSERSLEGLQSSIATIETDVQGISAEVTELRTTAVSIADGANSALQEIETTRLALAENAGESLQIELKRVNDAAAVQRKDHDEALTKHLGQSSVRADAAIDGLEADAARGRDLVQMVGDQSQAGGYLRFADREKQGYRIWIAVGTFIVIATLVYLAIEFRELAQDADPSIAVTILKTALSLTALAFSGFCFREAGKRQRQSLEARYRALDLLALRPFTYGMDPQEANLLVGMMGERLFKNPPEEPSKRSEEKVTTFRLDVSDLKTAVDTVKAVKDIAAP